MALDTYSNLKTTLGTWLARTDQTSNADDLIDMFEAWVNRNMRMPQMEQEATSSAAEYLALPSNFLELRDIQYQGSTRYQLEYMTPSMADLFDTTGDTGTPKFYTVVGDQIRLIPAPDTTTPIRIDYWKKITPLDDTNTSNWLLALYPDAYLYGSLMHGNVLIKDINMANVVATGWQNIMAEMKKAGKNANIASLMQIRPA